MRNKRVCCPKCESLRTKITCLRVNDEGTLIRRYRKCEDCAHTFRTTQPAEIYDDAGEMWGISRVAPGAHHAAVFSDAQIEELRQKFESGQWTRDELSVWFDTHYSYVCRIISRTVRS